THPFATRIDKKQASHLFSFDLHVLSTPPAFVLSQDQTLHDSMEELTSSTYCFWCPVSTGRLN
ncbi:hypothetical protein, partial [Megasphaera sp. BIOML-A1]|uniref:hypothetical protein n=1 Tax=Megasphaera sp. BIOML-A1 TaxID=2584661 RepID=UPI0019D5768C